jgi:hypothetical protein
MLDLDRIVDQDASIKNILDRKAKLDSLIGKAETQIFRGQWNGDRFDQKY